jgi:4-amino-4-deoxy-L-arabinose transferase-like glycosyltransferase
VLLFSVSAPQPVYLRYAQEYVKQGSIAEIGFPLEFSWFTGLSIKALGARGPEALEVALYLLVVISIWALARQGGATARNALLAGLAAALYPRLAEGVTKIWDVEISVLLMALLMLGTVSLLRHGLRPSVVLGTAVVFGLSVAQRPNMLLLFPLPLILVLATAETWRRRLLTLLSAGLLSLLVLVAVNTLAHGSFFWPQNGPYNFVQGHNEYSRQAMLQDLSSEQSVQFIVRADGKNPVGEAQEGDPELQRYFVRRALAYMKSHPLEEAKLLVVKLWTIFRPDTRTHRGSIAMTALIVGMALIFPAWLILLLRHSLRQHARGGFGRLDWVFIAAVVLYVLPFVLTASDPRYQIPLEICLLSHIACMAGGGSRNAPPVVGAIALPDASL